jgi:glycosyltransferase involved in cell wall biosynthesis
LVDAREQAGTPAAPAGPRRLLFVPVSGSYGMGEYARCLSIARAASARWPLEVHFVLSRRAPYAAATPFPHTLLPSSPTFHSAEVIRLLGDWRPDAVIFDNAGRTSQLRAAHALGARIIYISARARQRRKAFRLRWMRLLDEHWIAYPRFVAGDLGALERLKLRLLRRPAVRYLDVLIEPGDAARRAALLAQFGCTPLAYVLVVPGGGTGHPGARDAAGEFRAAARRLAAGGERTIFVGPAPAAAVCDAEPPLLCALAPLAQRDLVELMRGARLVLANGGSTLMQAIACGAACIGVAIADDQAGRLRRCVAAGAAAAAPLEAAAMAQAAAALLHDEQRRGALARAAGALGLADGIDLALDALARLLDMR